MALNLRNEVTFVGPAMPEPFVLYKLEPLLTKKKLLVSESKGAKEALDKQWENYQRKLRAMGGQGQERRVLHHVIEPLVESLGYATWAKSGEVVTREGPEAGGFLLKVADGTSSLRVWVAPADTDLDAPNKRGRAYRFSPALVAQRVLLAKGERIGLLTDGLELRVVLSDPSGRDSHLKIDLGKAGGWRGSRGVPDSFRLLRALCQPAGVAAVAELLDEARLAQTGVTKKLREQARNAVEGFIQGLMDDPDNRETRDRWQDVDQVSKQLWHEGLIFVYRLLFILKLETAADPARCFSFATVSTWRNSYSPSTALAQVVEKVREGAETGTFLQSTLRALFKMFAAGLSSNDLQVSALGGTLFGSEATPLINSLNWSEKAVSELLNALLWTSADGKRGAKKDAEQLGRERVHYGTLDVEDLGRVYEALLELEPGFTREPMCRLRRAKLEVVVPLAQGAPYRKNALSDVDEDEDDDDEEEDGKKGKTKVAFIEEIPANKFYLRVGLGRKASGSYYTPHAFVRFLVQETLGPQVAERSPQNDPNPARILELNVLDPAMGSGHFLVEACRYLGEALYEACRLCDELALEAVRKADTTKSPENRQQHLQRARELWQRVEDLPDPNDELLAYLPSRIVDGEQSGVSQSKALALCRRLVAVHCLYGVDKNPLAVELARVSLWLESYAEGLPLTFLDHRLIEGDSLTGPFFEHLLTVPGTGNPIEGIQSRGIGERLKSVLRDALQHVHDLEVSIGKDIADLELKRIAKEKLDGALAPLKTLAAVWSGGVMLGKDSDDTGYDMLLAAVATGSDPQPIVAGRQGLTQMDRLGRDAIAYDLAFPEVFHPDGSQQRAGGFHAVLGNPPWDAIKFNTKEFLAAFDLQVLEAPTKREREKVEKELTKSGDVASLFQVHQEQFEHQKRANDRLFEYQKVSVEGDLAGRQLDAFRVFAERGEHLLGPAGAIGMVFPSAFHANAGGVGVRRLYLEKLALKHCYSFENRRKLFDIHRSFKFAPVVATRATSGCLDFRCAFYLHETEWLFGDQPEAMEYSLDFVRKTGGEYLTFLELRGPLDVGVVKPILGTSIPFGELVAKRPFHLGAELHMTNDAFRFTAVEKVTPSDPRDSQVAASLLKKGYLLLHEGKTFHQFSDHWEERPRYVTALSDVADRPGWTGAARFFRFAVRAIASSTNERTAIFSMLPPGSLFGNSALCERDPELRCSAGALALLSVANSYTFDWNLRQRGSSNVNLFILNGCPVPKLNPRHEIFLSHSALRLVSNHDGYAALWEEQVGKAWRESGAKQTWPVLDDTDSRWAVRAAMDAVVANAYGLDREQYAHVLASFSHSSHKQAPDLCLWAFDELKQLGLEAFTQHYDPYWDIPLVTSLPKPVLDLPSNAPAQTGMFSLSIQEAPKPGRKKRARSG